MLVGHAQTGVDRSGCCAPIFVEFERARACFHHFVQRVRHRRIALAGKAEIHGKSFGGFDHPRDMPRAGRAGGGERAMRGAGAAAQHRGDAAHQCFFDLLRADEMYMRVKTASGENAPLARDDFGAGANDCLLYTSRCV